MSKNPEGLKKEQCIADCGVGKLEQRQNPEKKNHEQHRNQKSTEIEG